ncbi:unnamed protein product [Chilo suppressalis]|uniref:TIR domain-containing protein n=1 Tax=Chilo suppressalis TaxID=168631 RepID=A0ABN8L5T8_CHISP|nr:unnamed protein product [Chilo suppressalis]
MRLTAALTCAALLSLGVARAGRGRCPPACACGSAEGELDYVCGGVNVRALANDFAKITCKDVTNICDELPFIQLSSNDTLNSVSLTDCPVPETFRCVLERLGAADVERVSFIAPRGELRVNNMEGLKRTSLLVLMKAADQSSVPYDILRALPSLRDFRLRGAKLHLPADESSESDETGDSPAYPSLLYVELSSDLIEEVPHGAFRRLKGLPQLYLWDNQIRNINNESFIGMESLEQLDLSRNPFKVLPPGVFAHTPRLKVLTLTKTGLEEIPKGAITGLQMLEEITIKFGTGTVSFGSRALADLPSLKKLTIDRCRIKPVPSDLLQGDTKLQELVITGAGLEELPKQFFNGLVNLERLNLKENIIKALDSDIFSPLKALQWLNLNGNRIEMLPSRLFSGLTRLSTLSADRNHMKVIAPDSFQGAVNLQELSLMDNELTLTTDEDEDLYSEPPYSPFASLLQLRVVRLRDNRVRRVHDDWRLLLAARLRLLDLSRNAYTELTRADVQFLNANITVDLRENNITTVDVLEAPTWWPQEELPKKTLSVILLDENPFRCDCELFTFIRRLRGSKPLAAEPKLNPGNAKCTSPPSLEGYSVKDLTPEQLVCPLKDADCPSDCVCYLRPATKSLELDCSAEPTKYPVPSEFGLEEMRLTLHSPPATIETLPDYVVFLNLSGVGLTEIPEVPETVKELDLSNNSLSRPPMELLKNIRLRLSSNPFLCDCSHVEDVNLLQSNIYRILDSDKVTCMDGGFPWRLDANRLCDVRRAALLGGALAALGIVVAVAAALAYRYSLEIRIFLFSRGWCLKLVHEEDLDQNMQYDAFVSFSQKDARFVAEELVPKLEGENNLKLCVHYRDWLIGDMIPAQIARSVEQSRRTIIILSKSFLESSWALLEFRAAHLRSQQERRARVLVVVLEDLSEADMDAELRAYLTTNTYLRWGDPWFWKKLLYALPHRRSEVMVDKLKVGGLQTRLTADGMIVNESMQKLEKY